MSSGQPTYAAAFRTMLADAQRDQAWYRRCSPKNLFSVKKMYVFTAIASFVCFAVFGALIRIEDECLVVDPNGRCCGCVSLTDAQLDGQTIPKVRAYNNLFNGLVTILNACFGTVFVIYAVRFENRYLLFCMVATQFIEVVRCLLDVILDPTQASGTPTGFTEARMLLVIAGASFMFASWVLVRPVYKLFGWRIFRRGGARRSVRDMYKMFQRFRAINLLDIQGAFVLFAVYVAFLDVARTDIWVFALLSVCEIMASRFLIKYLKREDLVGVIITLVCKFVAMVWWVVVAVMYFACYARFTVSADETESWWRLQRVPDLASVVSSYSGLECLASHTVHDDRTLELITQTLIEAIVFRVISTVLAVLVCRNFHRGLRDLFYKKKKIVSGNGADERMVSEGEGRAEHDEIDPYTGEYSDDESRRYAESYNMPRGEVQINGPLEDE